MIMRLERNWSFPSRDFSSAPYNTSVDKSLFSVVHAERWESAPRGLPLIIALEGFSDAGNAVDQLIDHVLDGESIHLLAEFSNDVFLDYRARRPTITFIRDHLADYQPKKLGLYLGEDEIGEPFLLLAGYEPDFRWESFVREVVSIVKEFRVTMTTWVHAIPMPVPHTRPIGATVSGSNRALIESSSIWQPTTQLSASIGHAIEYELFRQDFDVTAFVLLIPHYLANTQFPHALTASLKSIMDATGLLFSTTGAEAREEAYMKQVDEQIRENAESVEMVETLEQRYDEFVREYHSRNDGEAEAPLSEDGELPTADQLATQLEEYLAKHWGESPDDNENPTLPGF